MKNYKHINIQEIKIKINSFQIVSGLDIIGIDLDFNIVFSFSSPIIKNDHQNFLIETLETIKVKLDSILESKHNYFKLYWQETLLYHVFLIKNKDENLLIMFGSNMGLNRLDATSESDLYNKSDHFLKLFQWMIEPYSNNAFTEPEHYQLEGKENQSPFVPEVSLIELYYENESLHATYEEFEEFKAILIEGKFGELEKKFDFTKMFQSFDQIELAKGDSLRSMKNHFIAACGIISQYAIDSGTDNEYARTLADKYINLVESLTSKLDIFKLMKEMIVKFSECIIHFSNPSYSNFIKKIIHYINTNFYESITLQDVAQKFNISPSHLSKKLKKETGMSFNDNLNKIRINESKKLLLQSDKSILEIAVAVGFNYQNHFGKVFKQIVGVTPNAFRNNRTK
ncbi:helix-turn-helix domain-containing protein [Gottfriedia sp. NPDC058432]|uniref:helix-turn-helix domain-containing protein n=1 Tax=Gottfriedia sp. NPDC058432 TaxID=3346497 RepID=UPI00364B9EF5